METSVELVNPQEFGIEEKTATELTTGLKQILAERDLLQSEFETVSKLEVDENSIPIFKNLRLRIRDNRTKGINEWHKAGKEYFLRGGQFLDAIKRKEIQVNENMERALEEGEKYFENLEKRRKEKLQADRAELLSPYVEDAFDRDLVKFEEDEFAALLQMKKKEFEDRIAAEKKAEEDRIAKEKAEAEERERIRKENEQLRKEAEERERQAKIEAEKRAKEERERQAKAEAERKEREEKERKEREAYEAKLKAEREEKERMQRELEAKAEAERKAKEEEKARVEAELNKGDAAKVKDLISDLESLKTKYTFKSAKNSKMYADVSTLIDKVINHINK